MAGIGEEDRRSSSDTEGNWGSLEAEGRSFLGEKREQRGAFMHAGRRGSYGRC